MTSDYLNLRHVDYELCVVEGQGILAVLIFPTVVRGTVRCVRPSGRLTQCARRASDRCAMPGAPVRRTPGDRHQRAPIKRARRSEGPWDSPHTGNRKVRARAAPVARHLRRERLSGLRGNPRQKRNRIGLAQLWNLRHGNGPTELRAHPTSALGRLRSPDPDAFRSMKLTLWVMIELKVSESSPG